MLRLKFVTSVSFDVTDADVIIHTSVYRLLKKIKVALLIPIQVLEQICCSVHWQWVITVVSVFCERERDLYLFVSGSEPIQTP